MSLRRPLALLLISAFVATAHAAPVTYQEISLLVRSGQTGQEIVNEAARRRLLQPLTAEQEAKLREQGASTALVEALRTPSLLATPEEAAAYLRRSAPAGAKGSRPGTTASAPARQMQPPPQGLPEPSLPTQPDTAPAAQASGKTGPVFVRNRFPEGLEAAKKGVPRVMKITDAYRLDQLPEAMAQAQSEQKPLGFVMVWGSMFAGKAFSSRLASSGPGLVHFYEAFKDSLVLVFVRHENEMEKIPAAVRTGFFGPDEGGFAPNMAVVDSTASEFIVQIPLGGAKATGEQRDAVFQAGAAKIYDWLTYHPSARGQAPAPGGR